MNGNLLRWQNPLQGTDCYLHLTIIRFSGCQFLQPKTGLCEEIDDSIFSCVLTHITQYFIGNPSHQRHQQEPGEDSDEKIRPTEKRKEQRCNNHHNKKKIRAATGMQ